jgi:hypothetical protein
LLVLNIYTGSFIMTFPSVYILYPELSHPLHFSFFFSSFFLVVCGYIVTFTKVRKIYQIYHSWI